MAGSGPHTDEERHDGPATEPRPSASVMLLRDGPRGPEVLLLERNPDQAFMGGAWVFPGGAKDRSDDDERATAIRELAEEADIRLARDAELVRYSRWITPAQIKRRFDTHFFLAAAPPDARARPDGGECVDARWLLPADALSLGERGELSLVFPTIKHLEALAGYRSASEALADARRRRVQPVEPRIVDDGGVARVLLSDDSGWESA